MDGVRIALGASFPIYRGWPAADALDAALAAGMPHVTVWPESGVYRVTQVTETQEWPQEVAAPSLAASVAGSAATFAGTCSIDQVAGIRRGTTAWATRCIAGSTPASVASALAAASGGSAFGATVTLTGLSEAKTGRDVPIMRASRQQEAGVRIIVWAPTPAARDLIAGAIDAALADVQRIALADGTTAIVRAAGSISDDKGQQSNLYRRDLRYRVEYFTTTTATRPIVLWAGATYAPGSQRLGALSP